MTQQEIKNEAEVLRVLATNQRTTSMSEIIQETGICAEQVRKAIYGLRLKGFPICSCRYGYELTTDQDKIRATVDSMSRRIINQIKSKIALEKHLKEKHYESNQCESK